MNELMEFLSMKKMSPGKSYDTNTDDHLSNEHKKRVE